MLKEFNTQNFQSEVLQNPGKVFVKFTSPTCGPCRMMNPVMKQADEKWQNVSFGEVDVSKNYELASRYGIMAVPTLMLFSDGDILAQSTGYMDIDGMENYFGELFNG